MTTKNKIDLKEDVNTLFEGMEINDDAKEKFVTTLEAIIAAAVAAGKTELTEANEVTLAEAKEAQVQGLEDNINTYFEYVVTEWMEENKLAVDTGIKVDMMENFIVGMKDLFAENYVEVPEGKEDVLTAAETQITEQKEAINDLTGKLIAAQETVKAQAKATVLAKESTGLTDSQVEKLATLVEDIEFIDAEQYQEKVNAIRTSIFKEAKDEDDEDDDEDDDDGKKKEKSEEEVKESARVTAYAEYL